MGIFEKGLVEGETRIITADPDKIFLYWSGDTQYISDTGSSTATVTMVDRDVRLTAVYNIPFEVCLGYIYNDITATDIRNLAPIGWRVPDETDFGTLLNNYVDATDAAYKLLDNDPSYWSDVNNFTNSDGLTLRGGGYSNGYLSYGDFYLDELRLTIYLSTTTYSSGSYEGVMALFAGMNGPWNRDFGDVPGVTTFASPNFMGGYILLLKEDSNDTGSMIDNDGNEYETVKIGNQVWTKTGIKSTKFRNGDSITRNDVQVDWFMSESPYYTIYNGELDDCDVVLEYTHNPILIK